MKLNFSKILSWLRILPSIGGLEVSDSALRYAHFDGKEWRTAAIRLAPGLVSGGTIADRAQFMEALKSLHAQITGPSRRRDKVNVVVSLSSVNIYSQVFSLPVIEGENLDKAIQLNIQMVSPGEASQTYSGWQMVGEDQKSVRLEILSSFISRKMVDDIHETLREGGFVVHSIESRALSLTRLIRQLAEGFDPQGSYIVLSLDSSGLEFMVIRKSQLYFQYFNSWKDLYGGEKQISREAFQMALTRNLHQVLNFYNSHWADPLAGIYVSATSLKDEVERIIKENFSMPILGLSLRLEQPADPDWFIALGSALRGLVFQREDREISLLGISAQEEFHRTQALHFAHFWRLLLPASLGILLLAFFAAYVFIGRTNATLADEIAGGGGVRPQEAEELRQKIEQFNRSAALIKAATAGTLPKMGFGKKIIEMAEANGIAVLRYYYRDASQPVLLTGRAVDEEQIKVFTTALKNDPQIQRDSVDLPLSNIRSDSGGVSFSMTFSLAAPKTP